MENLPLRVLLAEDNESDRLLFKDAFEELEIKTIVQTVNNGVQLMDYLTKADALLPTILFLDLNMPRKNGLECLKEIRSNKNFEDISIAIYSTSSSEKDMEETFLNGANVYITKPNDFEVLKKVLEKAVTTAYHYQAMELNRANFHLKL